jgi:hypothetical protein
MTFDGSGMPTPRWKMEVGGPRRSGPAREGPAFAAEDVTEICPLVLR